jgi:hypothetical protein
VERELPDGGWRTVAEDFRQRRTGASMSDPQAAALIDECQRQSENCGYTATNFTIWLRWLRGIRATFVVTPVIFGALATWKVLDASPTLAAVFMLLTTVIPPSHRALGIDEAIEAYTKAAGEMSNLRDRFRQAALISSHRPFVDFWADAQPLIARLERARNRTLTPLKCFS